MSIAIISDIAKSFGAQPVIQGVSFRIEERDRIGLVGANGAGKTTLLRLLTGQLPPDAGTIALAQHVRIGYLPQEVHFARERSLYDELLAGFAEVHAWEEALQRLAARLADPAVLADAVEYARVLDHYAELQARLEHADGYTIESRVRQVLDGLGFSREQQAAPAAHLSGGQQTRAALGRLLARQPDLMVLDEPTNHLDLATLEWLEGYLATWRGALVVVSHDRYFLDRVTTRTLEVVSPRVESYAGNYTTAARLRAERLERWAREYAAQQEHIARTEEFIRRYKAGQRSKGARGRQKLLDRLERIEHPPADEAIAFRFGAQFESGQIVLTTDKLVVGYAGGAGNDVTGAGLRVRMADTLLRRGERVALIGPNGSGKTTLLRTLIGEVSPLAGHATLGHMVHIGYYAQTHAGLNPAATVLDEIRQAGHLSEEGARNYLSRFLFSGDDVFKPIAALSGGERSHIALAKLTLQGANLLVLDEPTNQLDLPSRQVLEDVLRAYHGTLVFVSHDRYFVDGLATCLWVLESGAITVHAGNYSAYRARATQPTQPTAPEPARPLPRAGDARAKSGRPRQPAPGTRAIEELEAQIAALEGHVAQIAQALTAASRDADVERITALAAEYDERRAELESLYDAWQEIAS